MKTPRNNWKGVTSVCGPVLFLIEVFIPFEVPEKIEFWSLKR